MKPQAKSSAEMTRIALKSAVIEAPFLVAAFVVLLITRNYVWFVILVVMGIAAFMASFLPAYLRLNADAARDDTQAPIVEDPHGKL